MGQHYKVALNAHSHKSGTCSDMMFGFVHDAVAELLECRISVWVVGSSNSDPIKPIFYKSDTGRYLARHLILVGLGKDWSGQY